MTFKTKIIATGTEFGAVIPKRVLDELGLSIGDEVEIEVSAPKVKL